MAKADKVPVEKQETRLALAFVLPALSVVVLIAIFPLIWTVWESLHLHDLRMPWLGQPFIGLGNYAEAWHDRRVWEALLHTFVFVGISVTLELAGGLLLALAVERIRRQRGLARTAVLLPWTIPTVVVALVWRFLFESGGGAAVALAQLPIGDVPAWFAHPIAAWVPIRTPIR